MKRKKEAYCKDASYLKQMLNPGRSCTVASQCKSRNCQEVCIGYENAVACHKHEDCVEGFYCHDTLEWPYQSECKIYKEEDTECTSDYQCGITHFCWYKNKEERVDGTKRCMKMYSQEKGTSFGWFQEDEKVATLQDYTQNGKYCESGLAFPFTENEAKCTKTDEIKFDNVAVAAPYNCTASDPNKKCQIVYEAGTPEES